MVLLRKILLKNFYFSIFLFLLHGLCDYALRKLSQDRTHPFGRPRDFIGLLYVLNTIVAPVKMCFPHVLLKDKQNLIVDAFVLSMTNIFSPACNT